MKTFLSILFLLFIVSNINSQCNNNSDFSVISNERVPYGSHTGKPCTARIKPSIKVKNANKYSNYKIWVINPDSSSPLQTLKRKSFRINRGNPNALDYNFVWTANFSDPDPDFTRIKIYHYLTRKSDGVDVLVCSQVFYQCEDDYDKDGLLNYADHCMYEAGPLSNNGCPESNNTNLVVDLEYSFLYSQCSGCFPPLDRYFNNNQRHLIKGGVGSIRIDKLEIRNIGKRTSNTSVVNLYFSKDNKLNKTGSNKDKLLKEVSIPSRSSNSSYGIKTSISGWDINNNNRLGSGNYYILVDVDATNSNNEGSIGEKDNLLAIPIRYNETARSGFMNTDLDLVSENFSEENQKTIPYYISIYKPSGQMLSTFKVDEKEEENRILEQLEKGFYIVKSKHGITKIVKE